MKRTGEEKFEYHNGRITDRNITEGQRKYSLGFSFEYTDLTGLVNELQPKTRDELKSMLSDAMNQKTYDAGDSGRKQARIEVLISELKRRW